MKRRLLAGVLALILCVSAALPVYGEEALTPEVQAQVLLEVARFVQENCLTSSPEDDPLGRVFPQWQQEGALVAALEQDAALYDTLLREMLAAYDSHTMYIPAGAYSLSFPMTGTNYVGVGVTLAAQEEQIIVADVSLQGSAFAAGILAGDVLTAINGKSLRGTPAVGVSAQLRGEAGTTVEVTLTRAGQPYTVTLLRQALTDPIYQGRPLDAHVFYMKWNQFSTEEDSLQHFRDDLATLTAEDFLILDLRDNPGGDLDLACTVASDLLPERCTFFSFTQRRASKAQPDEKYFNSDGNGKALKHIYILTNENTASAAEVLTASLRDTGYATVIGTTTHGKARAQSHVLLPADAAAVVTVMGLLSIRDGDYEGVGLAPDISLTSAAVTGSCAFVPDTVALAPYSCSDNGIALHQALVSLGLLDNLPEKPYQVGPETLAALERLRCVYGLEQTAAGADIPVLRLVNLLLSRQKLGSYLRDDPLLAALNLCQQALTPALTPAA